MLARAWLPPMVQSRCGASDLVQQTLLDAHQGLPEFRGHTETQFRGWLRQILANHLNRTIRRELAGVRDVRRGISLTQALGESSIFLEKVLSTDLTPPADCAAREEQLLWLASALARLDERHRAVVELRFFHDLKLTEISDHLGHTQGEVVGILRTALAQLERTARSDGVTE